MKGCYILLFFTGCLFGQDLEQHQWKDRVIIITADQNSKQYLERQLAIFKNDASGLLERKLVVYSCEDRDCLYDNFRDLSSRLSFKRKPANGFQLQLIGLDGGLKYSSKEIISIEKLFAVIDGMPMRIRALKKKGYD